MFPPQEYWDINLNLHCNTFGQQHQQTYQHLHTNQQTLGHCSDRKLEKGGKLGPPKISELTSRSLVNQWLEYWYTSLVVHVQFLLYLL